MRGRTSAAAHGPGARARSHAPWRAPRAGTAREGLDAGTDVLAFLAVAMAETGIVILIAYAHGRYLHRAARTAKGHATLQPLASLVSAVRGEREARAPPTGRAAWPARG